MSAEVARVPLRQIGGAEASSAASVRSISSSTTGIQRATTNGPSSTTVGASRPPVTWATANVLSRANHANEGDNSSPPGVSDNQTAAPYGSRRTLGTDLRRPLGSSSSMRESSPYEAGVSCQPFSAPLHRLWPNPP